MCLPHFDALTHVVILVSSAFIFQTFAEVCYSVFVNRSSFKSVLNLRKAYIFKSFLKVYYQSVFAESFKTFIFQKFRRPLCHKVNLPRCEARRRRFIMTCDIFGTGQTNILGLCYIFGKTARSSSTQVTEINTLDLACVASVPNRVIARMLERRGSKKYGRGRGEEETLARKPHNSGKRPLIFHGSAHL